MRRRSATIVDVAATAGVSFKAVRRVLSGGPNVREATRTRVLQAVQELGYRSNSSARNLRQARPAVVSVLVSCASRNYASEVEIGVLQRCSAESVSVVFEHVGGVPDTPIVLKQASVSGVALVRPLTEDWRLLKILRVRKVPFVRLSPTEVQGDVGRVFMDDEQAAKDVTNYLLALGHRCVGFIQGTSAHPQASLKLAGFLSVMQGMPGTQALVAEGDFQFESGRRAASQWLMEPTRPTAIFASNDDMVAGVLSAAYRAGLRVPDDLTVVGFDDTPIANVVSPSLTTLRQPIREMSNLATVMLLGGPNQNLGRTVELPHEIVVRESTTILDRR